MASASCMWSRSQSVGSSVTRAAGVVPVTGAPRRRSSSRRRSVPRPWGSSPARSRERLLGQRHGGGGAVADLGGGPAGQPQQLLVAGGEDRVRVSGGGPDPVVPGQLDVDQRADRLRVADRG